MYAMECKMTNVTKNIVSGPCFFFTGREGRFWHVERMRNKDKNWNSLILLYVVNIALINISTNI